MTLNKGKTFIVAWLSMMLLLVLGPFVHGYFYIDPLAYLKNKTDKEAAFTVFQGKPDLSDSAEWASQIKSELGIYLVVPEEFNFQAVI